jgi:hypothetical protein
MKTTDNPRQLFEDIRFLGNLRWKDYEVDELLRIVGGDDIGYAVLMAVWGERAEFTSAEHIRERLLQQLREGGFVYRYQDRVLCEDALDRQLARIADLLWSLKRRANGGSGGSAK